MKAFVLLAAILLPGIAASTAAQSDSVTHREVVTLTDQQVDAGRFAIMEARGGVLQQHISVPGSVVPSGDHIARVAVRLLGTVSELRKRLGDHVEAGEVVAVVESREVADAKSEYLAARLVFNLQQTLFNRARTLFESKVMTENDYLRAQATFQDARIKSEAARQKLFALSLTAEQIEMLPEQPVETLRQQELRAPIAGRIAERRVELGALVGREGQESELYVIVDPRVLWADLAVPISDLPVAHERGDVVLSAGSHTTRAQIIFISPLIDPVTRAARVVARIDNTDGALRPGMLVSADIPAARRSVAMLVPKAALQTIGGQSVLFIRAKNGFEVRNVAIGESDATAVEVLSGLAPGERIATVNTFVLKAEFGKAEAGHDD